MKNLYQRYRAQLTNYFDSIELMAFIILLIVFAIKGPIDLFTSGHYHLLNYIGLSIKAILSVAVSFLIVLIIDCINANRKS